MIVRNAEARLVKTESRDCQKVILLLPFIQRFKLQAYNDFGPLG